MLGLPKLSFDPVLFLAPFLGGFRDYSGHGNHGTPSNVHWTARSGVDQVAFSSSVQARIDVPASPELDGTSGTILLCGLNRAFAGSSRRLIDKSDGGGSSWIFYRSSESDLRFYDGATNSVGAINPTGARLLGISWEAGEKPTFYRNTTPTIGTVVVNTGVNDAPITVGNAVAGGLASLMDYLAVLVYPGILPTAEIALVDTYCQSLITPRRQWPGSGLWYPGRGDPYTHATGDPTWLDGLQTARVSVGDETSGKLSNTGMDIVTGTWRVSEDATGRYYNCVGNGQIKRRVLGADAMVTRLFTEEGSATLTKTTTEIQIDALATDKIRAVQLEAA